MESIDDLQLFDGERVYKFERNARWPIPYRKKKLSLDPRFDPSRKKPMIPAQWLEPRRARSSPPQLMDVLWRSQMGSSAGPTVTLPTFRVPITCR